MASTGKHWEDLGFQGDDPSTDLRGGGMLSLWLMYSLHHHNPENAAAIYKLSRNCEHEFPFAIVCINVTVWAIKLIRGNAMNKQANKMKSMFDATKWFHAGTMYEFFRLWKSRGGTMKQSGMILKELEKRARSSIIDMVNLSHTADLGELVPLDESDNGCDWSLLSWPSCCTRRTPPLEFTSFSNQTI